MSVDILEIGRSGWSRHRRRIPLSVLAAGTLVVVLLVVAAFGPALAPNNPSAQSLITGVTGPSSAHLLGTDNLGRDILSRVMAGTRNAVIGPTAIALTTTVASVVIGLVAGYFGGIVDAVIMRIADAMYALPSILLSIVVVGVLGGGYYLAAAVIAVLTIPADMRVLRAAVLSERHLPYIDSCHTLGLSRRRVMVIHLLPNVLPTAVANLLLDFVNGLVSLSALSFLGLGAQTGSADWGVMLSDNRTLLSFNPWASIAPALLIIITAGAVTLLGDWTHNRISDRDVDRG